jgi:hypothetical protein
VAHRAISPVARVAASAETFSRLLPELDCISAIVPPPQGPHWRCVRLEIQLLQTIRSLHLCKPIRIGEQERPFTPQDFDASLFASVTLDLVAQAAS